MSASICGLLNPREKPAEIGRGFRWIQDSHRPGQSLAPRFRCVHLEPFFDPRMNRTPLLSALLFTFAPLAAAASQDADALFVRRVLPLLQEKCLACHGNDEAKIKGGLDLRTRAELLLGGDSDKPAIVSGQPNESPLYLAVTRTHADFEAMPPKEADKLSAEQIDWLKEWITAGAPWPDAAKQKQIAATNHEQWSAEDGIVMKTSGGLSADWTNRRYKPEGMWAYQPVTKPAVPVVGPAAGRAGDSPNSPGQRPGLQINPIDAFLAAKLPAGLTPAPAADARTFIRRATFDLTGLPPTPEEVAAFAPAYLANPQSAISIS